jgi:hypothetical protein
MTIAKTGTRATSVFEAESAMPLKSLGGATKISIVHA